MRVLMIGLGDIASKAYLPVLAGMPGVELHCATRDAAVLAAIGSAYRIEHLHRSAEAALAAHDYDAAFVHAATAAHPELVELLLRRDIPVLVDKPLASSFDAAARLVGLAERSGTLLTVGFNRRQAPDYAALRAAPGDMIVMQKHRHGLAGEARTIVFDDFIHVVDTLRFLIGADARIDAIQTAGGAERLRSIVLTLRTDDKVAIGIMHRDSGIDEERIDLIGGGEARAVLDIAERIERRGGTDSRTRRGDWTTIARQRGFEAMCGDFLDAVRARRPTAAADILETHRICEEIVRHATANG